MNDARQRLADAIARCARSDGMSDTGLAGVRALRFSRASPRREGRWQRSFVVVAQGRKEIALADGVHRYDEPHFIATPVELAVTSRVQHATPERPYLALHLDFDARVFAEVARQVPEASRGDGRLRAHALFAGRADDAMLDAASRLAGLAASPSRAPFLASLATQELYFHLLTGGQGRALAEFMRADGRFQKVSQAVHALRSDLASELRVAGLARRVGMSRTAFFEAFREVTALSPVQYLKRQRLLEARRLLLEERESAEGAARRVGYKSASQFSRDYARLFGATPGRDARDRRDGVRAAT